MTQIAIGTIVLIAGVVYILLNSNKMKENKNAVSDILTQSGRYDEYKSLIEDAIENNDYVYLEKKLKSKMTDFPDLIDMIKKALNNRK